jgi:hypothetical protein
LLSGSLGADIVDLHDGRERPHLLQRAQRLAILWIVIGVVGLLSIISTAVALGFIGFRSNLALTVQYDGGGAALITLAAARVRELDRAARHIRLTAVDRHLKESDGERSRAGVPNPRRIS